MDVKTTSGQLRGLDNDSLWRAIAGQLRRPQPPAGRPRPDAGLREPESPPEAAASPCTPSLKSPPRGGDLSDRKTVRTEVAKARKGQSLSKLAARVDACERKLEDAANLIPPSQSEHSGTYAVKTNVKQRAALVPSAIYSKSAVPAQHAESARAASPAHRAGARSNHWGGGGHQTADVRISEYAANAKMPIRGTAAPSATVREFSRSAVGGLGRKTILAAPAWPKKAKILVMLRVANLLSEIVHSLWGCLVAA